ncbi:3-phytase B [Lipomyces oligophaga]|uniref:3-phytase B n=1 Tax=Lipomyces oligophaga TaxID=45792 RepID=UPI0034CDC715
MAPVLSIFLGILASSASFIAASPSNRPGTQARYPFATLYDQSFSDGYSLLKHIGGNGPYSNRESYGIGRDPPDACAVDQVIMLRRHGERFPDPSTAANFVAALDKFYASAPSQWTNELEFLNTWKYMVPDDNYLALESYNGPYAGLLTSYKHGVEYGVRYGHLWNSTLQNQTIPMFSSGYERIVQTARKFGEGFFGWNYTDVVAMNIIPEFSYLGGNSLTPSCLNDTGLTICDSLTGYQPQFDVAAKRLNTLVSGLNLTALDVNHLMQMAAFEVSIRGYSDWVEVFNYDEWVAFGYTQDLSYYYCSGPGDKNMRAVGSVFVNASLTALNQGPETAGPMLWNFCHDTNITPVLAALGIPKVDADLPLDSIPFPNPYNSGNIVPMGGHITIERLSCNATATTTADTYVRLVLNEAVVPFPGCQNGPGFSCGLANFTQQVFSNLPDFVETCNYNESYPQYLSFWWDYNTTKAYDYDTQSPIPGQESLITYQGTNAQ